MKKGSILSLLILVLVGCNQQNTDVANAIDSVVEDESKNEIYINDYTNFDWGKAYLFPPYTPTESIEEELGTTFKHSSNIDYRDDIYLFVFLHEEEVVQSIEIERQGADFHLETDYLTPSEDVIYIDRH